MILDKIVESKRLKISERKKEMSLELMIKKLEKLSVRRRNFKKAVSGRGINIIAEVKKGSPSKGVFIKKFDPAKIAYLYEFSGASAISVLTEEDYFYGGDENLKKVREVTALPLLRKDFIIDIYQVYESALIGADAVLLISSLLEEDELREFIGAAKLYGMDALVEVHNYEELKRAVNANAEIIGINNRNLHTFETDIAVTKDLLVHVPAGKVVVSESGISDFKDIYELKSLGVNAFLIGESLITSGDIIAKMYELKGETWKWR